MQAHMLLSLGKNQLYILNIFLCLHHLVLLSNSQLYYVKHMHLKENKKIRQHLVQDMSKLSQQCLIIHKFPSQKYIVCMQYLCNNHKNMLLVCLLLYMWQFQFHNLHIFLKQHLKQSLDHILRLYQRLSILGHFQNILCMFYHQHF